MTSESAGVRLRLADGSSDVADVAVSCAGRWTTAVMAGAGYSLPMVDHETQGSSAVGYLAYSRPTSVRLGRVSDDAAAQSSPGRRGAAGLAGLDLDGSADPGVGVDADGPTAQESVAA